jgi:pimeloyl-ACP methyl ester carboxylesterase
MILTGSTGAPARAAFHPIMTWNWVKANDKTGEIFACQQFTWLFSAAFLRNADAVKQTVAMLSSNPNPVGPQAYNRQAQALLQFDVLDRLAAVKAPTLCVVGEQDLLSPIHECREVADKIPGAKFEVIKGDGSSHVLPIERADDFNGLVRSFLS